MSPRDTTAWPELHTRVVLFGPWYEAWLPSIIEDRDDREVQVAVPTGPGSIVPVIGQRGDVVTISWTCGRGRAGVDCRLIEVRKGALASWHLHAMTEPKVSQRRSYVRAKVHMPVTLLDVGAEPTLAGWVVDLSEGGLRMVTVDEHLAAGDRPLFQLEVEGQELLVRGEVLRTWPDKDGYATVAVKFVDLHRRDADRIRRLVFGAQVRTPAGRR
jgi:c-di-GMP-binding flagellar brake protein YcgR